MNQNYRKDGFSDLLRDNYIDALRKVSVSIIILSRGQAQQMIKYNNKEESHQEVRLETIPNIQSPRITSQKSKGHLKQQRKATSNEKSFSSQSPVGRDIKSLNNLADRRSKSHKINYERLNRSKLRNQLLRKREGRSNKMDLLVILPNNCQEEKYHQDKQSLDNLSLNHRATTKFSESTPFQASENTPSPDNNRFTVRGDIAIGKMKLLAHKSKLTPIRKKSKEFKQTREMHQSEEKFIDIERMQATSYKHFQQRERLTIERLQSNQRIANQRYLKISSGNPLNLMNIHSLVPNLSIAEKLSYGQQKPKRRTTQPNIDTTDQFYKVPQQGLGTLYDRQFKESFSKHQPEGELNFNQGKQRIKTYSSKLKSIQWKRKVFQSNLTKFIQPYQTYYYRDMLWKVNYSNRQFVEPPLQYQHRLKAYVGKGNNSAMVRGLISRRYWFAISDRIQQANFVWTQLKQFRYFAIQNSSTNLDKIASLNKIGTYAQKGLLLNEDNKEYRIYCERNKAMEEHSDERMLPRLKHFTYSLVVRGHAIKQGRLHNHLINNYIISNKKSLFRVLSSYYRYHSQDPFQVIPITYHVSNGLEDPTFLAFQRYYHHQAKSIRKGESNRRNYWIIKPGQNSNRGFGIKLCFKLSQIKAIVRQKGVWEDGSQKTYILQSYIEKPLLYYKRKFDIRHYMLITSVNGFINGYWYSEGYVRTTSSDYTLDFNGSNVHLTNDAIQKYLPNYGKYEKGNKLSYDQLEAYIKKKSSKHGFYTHIYPQMRKIAIDIIKASANYLDPKKLNDNFQLFGLDYMIDEAFNVWLIEVNSNPCLQLSCPLLSIIIPNLIENVLELTMDARFPPAVRYSAKIPRYLGRTEDLNKFELVFDERAEQILTFEDNMLDNNLLQQKQDEFQDNVQQWQDKV